MKTILLLTTIIVTAGCQSGGEKLREHAATCNKLCGENPGLSQFSAAAGGGFPLLFAGGEGVSCGCHRK